MKSSEIRAKFLEFFKSKEHLIVPSAPMVVKDDPTLMFTNAGMNQFKDVFLGHHESKSARISDSQKCLRVSGKHNDLEEVGHDTYHHTMFEMLGNWSFGDYFKEEAIAWAWELLTDVYGIDKDRLYVTVFGGHAADGMEKDMEAYNLWKQWINEDRIIDGSKKDNFWEMGDMGPCGPCSEIHIDIRSDEERKKIDGKSLVNQDHPLVIEIWNLVFIQFNRKADGSLENLPQKHIDTGMGFERLAMVLQKVQSNYDTDVFQPLIQKIAQDAGIQYGKDEKQDVAIRVISDHLRAVAFAIADGQMPSNNKAGYVIRRILRRAIRYGYTFLNFNEAFVYQYVALLVEQMGAQFPELKRNESLITNVIREEENSFLKTLSTGLSRLQKMIEEIKSKGYKFLKGAEAFELYDTYGFPFDLTELILKEEGMEVAKREFDEEMAKQKARSKADAVVQSSDMVVLLEDDVEEFVGYEHLETHVKITRYRKVKIKNKEQIQLVFNITPFYAESGGQIGDTGVIISSKGESIRILNTVKENNLIIHICDKLPQDLYDTYEAKVDTQRRRKIAANHTATHLLHHALREVLGTHVEQKGSLVTADYFRFDFSHFKKMDAEEIQKVEHRVNAMIRDNQPQDLYKDIPIEEAQKLGAMSLFGEKYGDLVRVVKFGDSIELCGGTHAAATGNIGLFLIRQETSIAAGIRRIEAITGDEALHYFEEKDRTLKAVKDLLKNPKDVIKGIDGLLEQNKELQKELSQMGKKIVQGMIDQLKSQIQEHNGKKYLAVQLDLSSDNAKDLVFTLNKQLDDVLLVVGLIQNQKPLLMVAVGKALLDEYKLNAGQIIRELAKEIKGGGGGQPHFATAGGKDSSGLSAALAKVKTIL